MQQPCWSSHTHNHDQSRRCLKLYHPGQLDSAAGLHSSVFCAQPAARRHCPGVALPGLGARALPPLAGRCHQPDQRLDCFYRSYAGGCRDFIYRAGRDTSAADVSRLPSALSNHRTRDKVSGRLADLYSVRHPQRGGCDGGRFDQRAHKRRAGSPNRLFDRLSDQPGPGGDFAHRLAVALRRRICPPGHPRLCPRAGLSVQSQRSEQLGPPRLGDRFGTGAAHRICGQGAAGRPLFAAQYFFYRTVRQCGRGEAGRAGRAGAHRIRGAAEAQPGDRGARQNCPGSRRTQPTARTGGERQGSSPGVGSGSPGQGSAAGSGSAGAGPPPARQRPARKS